MAKSPGEGLVELFGKLVISVLIVALALTPFWIFLATKHLLDPQDFWQKFLVLGVGVYLLGGLQIICLCAAIAAIWACWTEI